MADLHRRLARLEEHFGDARCTCERNEHGYRLFVSTSEADVAAAHARFDGCLARHTDKGLVVQIRRFGPATADTGAR